MDGAPSIKDTVAEEVSIARRAYLEGKRDGVLLGHERGQIEGYAAGFAEGARSSHNYRLGYNEGRADQRLEDIAEMGRPPSTRRAA